MAHLESLIVFDPEERSREALTFGFTREGFKVYATGDPGDAVSMARTKVPQLVICAVPSGRGPAAEALDLIGTLREEGATRDLPVVALGERNAREQSLRAGADEFVAKPAFIRDVLTLSSLAVALRQDGDESGVAGMLSDYELYFLTRALSTAERTGVLEMERGARSGEVHFVKGEVVHARCGKMNGLAAFHHLLLWTEASIHLRMTSPAGERKIHLPIDQLLQGGAEFAREFEAVSERVGGTQAVYRQEVRKAAETRAQIPPEVMKILKVYDGKRALIDLVEDSPFKPLDTIKITFRLQELGVIERLTVGPDGTPLTAELAVRDWLLGSQKSDGKSSVTEAGRRAAEAYAEESERRAKVPPPELDILDDTAKVRLLAESQPAESKTGKKKKVRKRPPAPPADVEQTIRTPKVDLQPSQPPPPKQPAEFPDATIPFSKMPLERNDAAGVIDSSAALPSRKKKSAPPSIVIGGAPAKPANVNANVNASVNAQIARPGTNGAAHPPAKHAPAAKGTPRSAPVREPTAPFTKSEEEFFKEGIELARKKPVVDTFADLEPADPTSPKRRWWNLTGKKFDQPGPKSPKKR